MVFFGLIETSYSWIRAVSNTYLWIFLDCMIVKLLWFAFLILFNVMVAPVSTISRYGAKTFCLGHPQLVITSCHFWLRAFFRPPFCLPPPPPGLLIFRLSVGPPFLLWPPPIIWNWRVLFKLMLEKADYWRSFI